MALRETKNIKTQRKRGSERHREREKIKNTEGTQKERRKKEQRKKEKE
jgi:hypothetical protein